MSEKLLRLTAVKERTGCSQSKLYALMQRGDFPRPIKLDGCALWPESKVVAWIDALVAANECHAS